MVVGLHRGRDLCPDPCPGRDLCSDPGRGRRSGPPRLDLPEVLEVLLARPLEWWSTRRPSTKVRTNLPLAISSFRFSPMVSLGQTIAAASHRT